MKRPIAVDLFCGVGGMSLGFEQAGFNVVGAFDVESRHVETYRKNFSGSHAHVLDLSKAKGKTLRELSGLGSRQKIDVVFGGPPCQGFSVGGRRRKNDPRNFLLTHFARLVGELRPRYFVMENVEGLLLGHAKESFQEFVKAVKAVGFRIIEPVQVLDAAEYGVPQRRRRTIVIGYREGAEKPAYPKPQGLKIKGGKTLHPKVRDAIADLPHVGRYVSLFEKDAIAPSKAPTSYYAKLLRGDINDETDRSSHREKKATVLTGCLRTSHSKKTVTRFRRTRQGAAEPISHYIRLDLDDVAPTIRAGTGNDHGSHTAPRPIHPTQPRCITVREAARLHSFPDWFEFHSTRWHAFRQIGNAVPPRLAREVASGIFTYCN